MLSWLLITLLSVLPSDGGSPGSTQGQQERSSTAGTAADQEAIVKHIRSIFDAYIRQDREALQRTHAKDWVGFLGPSTGIERGIAAYMQNAERSLQAFRGVGYEILDMEVQIYGDLALVYYVARYDYRTPAGEPGSLGLRSLDVYRREHGEWNQAGSHITRLPGGGSGGPPPGRPEAEF